MIRIQSNQLQIVAIINIQRLVCTIVTQNSRTGYGLGFHNYIRVSLAFFTFVWYFVRVTAKIVLQVHLYKLILRQWKTL